MPWRQTGLLLVLAASLGACRGAIPEHSSGIAPPSPGATAAPAAPASERHGAPLRLSIPKFAVDADIEEVGSDPSGAMGTPRDYRHVAWYAPGVVPGDHGDAVIDGHLDWVVDGREVQGVFWKLDRMAPGDEFDVATAGGELLRYSVTQLQLIPDSADPAQYGLFATDGDPRVTLITCAGEWSSLQHTYLKRLAVTGTEIYGSSGPAAWTS